MDLDGITEKVIGAAIRVHSALGPGLLESAYESCLSHELMKSGLPFLRQKAIPLVYDGVTIDVGYRADLIVAESVIIEIKSVERLARVHEAQLLSYLRLSGLGLGLLLNFNVARMVQGIKRMRL